jgi:DNA-binding CsgD family transcriptional regulator
MTTNLDRYEMLTAHEREVLQMVGKGLAISETDRTNLMHKLELHTEADLVRFALRREIITMEE